MQNITFPIASNETSDNVANLQQALMKLLPLLGIPAIQIADAELASKTAGDSTIKAVQAIQGKYGIHPAPDVLVDSATAELINQLLKDNGLVDESTEPPKKYTVSGKVFNQFGEGIGNKTVMAYDVDLKGARIYKTAKTINDINENGGMQLLGNAVTAPDGTYSISFTDDQFNNVEIGLADVVCYATQAMPDGTMMIIARSAMTKDSDYKDGITVENLNVLLFDSAERGMSEYARLVQVLEPFLQQNELQLFQLSDSEDQINFLASETNQDLDHTTLVIQADKLRSDYPDLTFSTELLYGIGRQNMVLSWPELLKQTADKLSAAIQRSVYQNIIAPQDAATAGSFVQNIMNASADHSLTAPETATLYKTIGFSLTDTALQKTMVQSFLQFNGKPENFWDDLSKKDGFTPDMIASLQFTNQLSLLTGQQTALIEELQVKRGIRNLVDLLTFSTEDWHSMINTTGIPGNLPGDAEDEKANTYINGMRSLLQAAFPTQTIALMVNNNQLHFDDENIRAKVTSFFSAAQAFDISNSRVVDFDTVIKDIAGDLHDEVQGHLLRLQRIYQVSPTPEAMASLIEKGYNSAYHITSFPQDAFIQTESKNLGSDALAFSVYNRASHVVMRAKQAFLKVRDTIDRATPSRIISRAQQDNINNYINSLNTSK